MMEKTQKYLSQLTVVVACLSLFIVGFSNANSDGSENNAASGSTGTGFDGGGAGGDGGVPPSGVAEGSGGTIAGNLGAKVAAAAKDAGDGSRSLASEKYEPRTVKTIQRLNLRSLKDLKRLGQ